MATIAEQLTSLANTKTAIKDAIVAKGVQVADDTPFSGYATKIGEISGGGAATKFGASVDTFLGDVVNGVLQAPTAPTALNFAGVTEIGRYTMSHMFYNATNITSADFSSVQTVGHFGLYNAFYGCTNITSVDFSSLTTIGNSGLYNAFYGCTNITSVDFSSLTTVDAYGLTYAFYGCKSLITISFPSLTSVHASGFGSSTFQSCTNLTEIHFRADMQSTIEATSGYSSKFGASNATVYFDL